MNLETVKKTLAMWERAIRQDERAYLLELLAAVQRGECESVQAAESLQRKPSIMDAMTRAERARADRAFLKSLGIQPISGSVQ